MGLAVGLALLVLTVVDAVSIPGAVRQRLVQLSEVVAAHQGLAAPPCVNSTMDIGALDLNKDGFITDDEFLTWGLGKTPALAARSGKNLRETLALGHHPAVQRRSLQQHGRSPFKTEAELHACEHALYHMQTHPGSHVKLHVYMMSKCPFAARTLHAMIPAMMQMQLFDYVTLRLDFIGHGERDSMSGLQSLHGGEEVLGDKYYLCIQERELPIQTWMLIVICIASDPQAVPHNVGNCLDVARISPEVQTEIKDCAETVYGRGDQLLEKSFRLTTRQHQIADSPTIFFTAEQKPINSTGVPKVDVLYCGDRQVADFISALCSMLGTLLRSEDLRQDMIFADGVDQCPSSMQDEPECTDNSVKMRSAWFMVPVLFFCCSVVMFVCHSLCLRSQTERNRRRRGRLGVFEDDYRSSRGNGRQAGLTADQVEQLPTVVIGPPSNEDDRPICSICFDVLEDGARAYQLSCRHHHHQECLRDWLARKAECPECRTPVSCTGADGTSDGTFEVNISPVYLPQPSFQEGGHSLSPPSLLSTPAVATPAVATPAVATPAVATPAVASGDDGTAVVQPARNLCPSCGCESPAGSTCCVSCGASSTDTTQRSGREHFQQERLGPRSQQQDQMSSAPAGEARTNSIVVSSNNPLVVPLSSAPVDDNV